MIKFSEDIWQSSSAECHPHTQYAWWIREYMKSEILFDWIGNRLNRYFPFESHLTSPLFFLRLSPSIFSLFFSVCLFTVCCVSLRMEEMKIISLPSSASTLVLSSHSAAWLYLQSHWGYSNQAKKEEKRIRKLKTFLEILTVCSLIVISLVFLSPLHLFACSLFCETEPKVAMKKGLRENFWVFHTLVTSYFFSPISTCSFSSPWLSLVVTSSVCALCFSTLIQKS